MSAQKLISATVPAFEVCIHDIQYSLIYGLESNDKHNGAMKNCHFQAGLHCIRKLIDTMEVDRVGNSHHTSQQLTLASHQFLNAIQQVSLVSLQKTNI